MTELDSLLQAILREPGEDLPRLVFADWLDDHADTMPDPAAARARASFIRLSIRAFQDDAENGWVLQPHLHHPRKELFALSRLQFPERVIYSRGFPAKVTLPSLADWERWGKEIAAAAPVTEMVVGDREPTPRAFGTSFGWIAIDGGTVYPEARVAVIGDRLKRMSNQFGPVWVWFQSREEALALASRAFADEARARASLPPVWTSEKAHV